MKCRSKMQCDVGMPSGAAAMQRRSDRHRRGNVAGERRWGRGAKEWWYRGWIELLSRLGSLRAWFPEVWNGHERWQLSIQLAQLVAEGPPAGHTPKLLGSQERDGRGGGRCCSESRHQGDNKPQKRSAARRRGPGRGLGEPQRGVSDPKNNKRRPRRLQSNARIDQHHGERGCTDPPLPTTDRKFAAT